MYPRTVVQVRRALPLSQLRGLWGLTSDPSPFGSLPLNYKSNSAATISRRVLEKSRWSLVILTPLVLACRSAGSTANPGERRRLSLSRQQGTNLERRPRIQYRQPFPFRAKRSDHGFHRPHAFQERASRLHDRPGVAISIPPGQWAL